MVTCARLKGRETLGVGRQRLAGLARFGRPMSLCQSKPVRDLCHFKAPKTYAAGSHYFVFKYLARVCICMHSPKQSSYPGGMAGALDCDSYEQYWQVVFNAGLEGGSAYTGRQRRPFTKAASGEPDVMSGIPTCLVQYWLPYMQPGWWVSTVEQWGIRYPCHGNRVNA